MGDSATLKSNRLTACVDDETAAAVYLLSQDYDRTVSWTIGHLIEIGIEHWEDEDDGS